MTQKRYAYLTMITLAALCISALKPIQVQAIPNLSVLFRAQAKEIAICPLWMATPSPSLAKSPAATKLAAAKIFDKLGKGARIKAYSVAAFVRITSAPHRIL